MAKKRKVDRSAKSGQFVTHAETIEHPAETITQTVDVGERDPTPNVIKGYLCDPAPLPFISETDDNWQVWVNVGATPKPLSTEAFNTLVGGMSCTDAPFESWFDATIRSQGISQGKETRMRYEALKECLVKVLYPRYIFKVQIGAARFAYYAVGMDYKGHLLGCRVEAVET